MTETFDKWGFEFFYKTTYLEVVDNEQNTQVPKTIKIKTMNIEYNTLLRESLHLTPNHGK